MIREQDHSRVNFYAEPLLVIKPGTFQGTKEELAALISKQIENHPESFNMGGWIDSFHTGGAVYDTGALRGSDFEEEAKIQLEEMDGTECGTTLCIAGYAQLFVDGEVTEKVRDRAAALLGLPWNEENDYWHDELFYLHDDQAREQIAKIADGSYDQREVLALKEANEC